MGSAEELPSIVHKLNGDTRWRAAFESGGYDDEDIQGATHIAQPGGTTKDHELGYKKRKTPGADVKI